MHRDALPTVAYRTRNNNQKVIISIHCRGRQRLFVGSRTMTRPRRLAAAKQKVFDDEDQSWSGSGDENDWEESTVKEQSAGGRSKKGNKPTKITTKPTPEAQQEAPKVKSNSDIKEGGDSPASNTNNNNSATRPYKRKRRYHSESEDEEEDEMYLGPTSRRLTKRGGYSHTTKSRARISRANRGNTPWNKGKNRSEETRARISAGVKARNRAILLKKLEDMGLSEEVYLKTKKEVKYIRERVRRKKIELKKRKEEFEKWKLEEALQAENEAEEEESESESESEEEPEEFEPEKEPEGKNHFQHDVDWNPHTFDSQTHSYKNTCPTGGPGGLICCEMCANVYSQYMSQTATELEAVCVEKVEKEAKELMGFLQDSHAKLNDAVENARRKPPPACSGRRGTGGPHQDMQPSIDNSYEEGIPWEIEENEEIDE